MTPKTLHISPELTLPIDAVTGTFCIVGIRGSGKSTTAVDMAEEMLKAKQQIVVLDPKDDWWGLRSSADGTTEGFPVTIFGGKHQDAPLEYAAGALVAQWILSEGISVIISTKHLSDGQRFRFTYDFCDYLYKHCSEPMHLFLDEADQFAPQERQTRIQKGDNISEAMMLSLVRRVIKQGRTSGLGISLITQSPATLDKRVMNMCETMIAMRVVGAQDFDAVKRWFNVWARTKDVENEISSMLPTLKTGQGVFYSPSWLGIYKVVKFRMAETFDSRRTPKVGERRVEPKVLAPVDLKRLSAQMAATIEKVKSEDPKELRKEIVRLKAEKDQLAHDLPRAVAEVAVKIERVEVPVLKDKQIKDLDQWLTKSEGMVKQLSLLVENLFNQGSVIRSALRSITEQATPAPNATQVTRNGLMVTREPVYVRPSPGKSNGEYDMATFEQFRDRLLRDPIFMQRISAGGTVQVEPKEVLLKKFQQAEVDRLLEKIDGFSVWQRQVLQFVEARAIGLKKAEILKGITGKSADQQANTYKTKYAEIDAIVSIGVLRNANERIYPNLNACVKAQLSNYNASDQEIEDVAGQVLLRIGQE